MSRKIAIQNAYKKFGDVIAVNNVSFNVEKGEFFSLLGPSGCGKTTILRMIAGFNKIDGGELLFDGQRMNDVEASKRDIGMVFQNYAIFPHMNVYDNVAYGLKIRKLPKSEQEKRVKEVLELVRISDLAKRMPAELSGGQQQRVALARAIVIRPGILLMDEPLSNLDAKLRLQMRSEIKRIQQASGITTIYVTHDQEEAMAVSDRIAVMQNGRIEQIGTPREIYEHPASSFVAGFIGRNNFLHIDGRLVCVRPQNVRIASEGLPAQVLTAAFFGDFMEYGFTLEDGQKLTMRDYNFGGKESLKEGDKVFLELSECMYFDESAV